MCEITLQMILFCNCSLSLNVCNIGLQFNLRFFSTTVLQGSVEMQVNGGRIFNDCDVCMIASVYPYCSMWTEVWCHLPGYISWQGSRWRHSCCWSHGAGDCMLCDIYLHKSYHRHYYHCSCIADADTWKLWKSWKLKFKVLKSPGINLWHILSNVEHHM